MSALRSPSRSRPRGLPVHRPDGADPETVRDLARRYGHTEKEVENAFRIAEVLAYRWAARYARTGAEAPDFVGSAYRGMLQALESYDAERGAALRTYVYQRVTFALQDDSHGWDHLSKWQRTIIKTQEKRGEATPEWVLQPPISCDVASLTEQETLPPERVLVERLAQQQQRQRLREALRHLSPAQAELLLLLYWEGLSLSACARRLGQSCKAMQELQREAETRLREVLGRDPREESDP